MEIIISTVKIMLVCLVMTLFIELALSYILKVRNKMDLLNIFLVNILTNPILVIITYIIGSFYGNHSKNIITFILEILVVLIEGYIYKKVLNYKLINGYILSLILNLNSFILGLLVNLLIY